MCQPLYYGSRPIKPQKREGLHRDKGLILGLAKKTVISEARRKSRHDDLNVRLLKSAQFQVLRVHRSALAPRESSRHLLKTGPFAPFFDALGPCNVCAAETDTASRSRIMCQKTPHTPTTRLPGQKRAGKDSVFPLSTRETRPDPKVLSSAERMSEFGRLILRVIERRPSRKQN